MNPNGQAKRVGKTGYSPLMMAERMGNTVTLRASLAGHTPTERQFDLATTDYTVKLHLDVPAPSFGFVNITAPRGLAVYLNSDELDRLPLKKHRLKTGAHRLTVVDQKSRKRRFHPLAGEGIVFGVL